tara:strand:+ start:3884 stop:3997 length:114 start_codon:yes stop_codon:yes gene_type:complete
MASSRVSSPSRPEDEAASTVSFSILSVEETKERHNAV